MTEMTSSKPYLLRAMYQWIEDNQCTPYMLVDAEFPGVQVPREYVKDGQIVLNISSVSTQSMLIGDVDVEFNARFAGQPRHVIIPVSAVLFIYARETSEGMPFAPEDKTAIPPREVKDAAVVEEGAFSKKPSLQPVAKANDAEEPVDKPASETKDKKRSHLKVIK